VANAPGETIMPGDLKNALTILANGGQVNYEGATGVEFNSLGEVLGSYKELELINGKYETINVR